MIIKVISGHNCLNHHLFRTSLSYTAICTYCIPENQLYEVDEPLETAHHILCDCPAFSKERNDIYSSHIITEDYVFSRSTIRNLERITKFFNKVKVLNRAPKYSKIDLSPQNVQGEAIIIQTKDVKQEKTRNNSTIKAKHSKT